MFQEKNFQLGLSSLKPRGMTGQTMKAFAICLLIALPFFAQAEPTRPTGRDAASLVLRDEVRVFWSGDGGPLAWRVNTARDEHRFFKIDPAKGRKSPAFDHELLAGLLGKASGEKADSRKLPMDRLDFAGDGMSFRFRAFGKGWKFDHGRNEIVPDPTPPESAKLMAPEQAPRGTRNNGPAVPMTIENATGGEIEMFWVTHDG